MKICLISKYYNFFVARICTNNDGSQNTFVHQKTFHALELKKAKVLIMSLV